MISQKLSRSGFASSCSQGPRRAPQGVPRTPPEPSHAGCKQPDRATSSDIMSKVLAVTSALAVSVAGATGAHAEVIGEFDGSGFLFKDTVRTMAYDDPDVQGITLYVSEFQRNLADKLKKDFFSEPSQASLTCAATGPVVVTNENRLNERNGVEVFAEKKSLNLFQDKTLRIRRLFDAKRSTAVYVAYSTRLSSASDDGGVTTGRYRTSICTVQIPRSPAPAVQAE